MKNVYDPGTEFEIATSGTPVSEDGYKHNEPKYLECAHCSARVLLTEEPSPGVDELPHDPDCPQRWARTPWWHDHFLQDGRGTSGPRA